MLFVRIVEAGGNVFKVQLSCSRVGYLKVNMINIGVLKGNRIRTRDLQIALMDIDDVVALVDVCIIPKDVLRNRRLRGVGHTSPKYLRGLKYITDVKSEETIN